jgi:hypothetical protein
MNKTNSSFVIKFGILTVLAALAAGCVGYVGDGYDGGGVVVEPDVTLYGGVYGGGHWHDYDNRGHASWGAAHGGRHH